MARHRQSRFVVSRLPSQLRSAAAGTAISVIAIGTASLALAPSAEASTGTSSACPTAALVTGSAMLDANAPPKLRHDKILTVEDTSGTVNVLDNDASSAGPLTVTGVSDPGHGAVTWTPAGEVTYQPDDGFVGFDGFTYSARDTAGRTADGGTIGVRVCNVGPTAEAVSLVGTFNKPVGFNPLEHASAPAGDKLSLWSFTQPSHGQTGVVGDQLVYLPDTGFTGTDNFTYTVTDGQGVCSTAPVTVRVPVLTEVSPVPPIRRSPTPTLPATGPANVGWLALAGLLLVGLGGALLFGSARLEKRPAPVVRVKDDPGLEARLPRWYTAMLSRAFAAVHKVTQAGLHQPVVGGMRGPPRARAGPTRPSYRIRGLIALQYF